MPIQKLHIVSFDNPFPPKYGGVIDVFYKIKALSEIGVEIYLHSFVDEIPFENPKLENLVKKVFYYKRDKSKLNFFSNKPFSVISRNHKDLYYNLSSDNAPILFEGLQTTYVLTQNKFENRKIYLRLHNLEDNYYLGLCNSETNLLKKTAYYLESKKYASYLKIIKRFNTVFTLSKSETEFVDLNFKNASYVPVFHGNTDLQELSEFGDYAFYVGDLRISDNKRAVSFLINVFKKIPDYKLIIASSILNEDLYSKCKLNPNISFVIIKNEGHLNDLIKNAHINVMLSFQESGTKLKAVNALYKSRFCVINRNMLDDLDLQNLCILAENENDFIDAVNNLKNKPYSDYDKRKNVLEKVLNDKNNVLKIVETVEF